MLAGGRGDGGGMLRRSLFCCTARSAPHDARAPPDVAPPAAPVCTAAVGLPEAPAAFARCRAVAMTPAVTSAAAAACTGGTGKRASCKRAPTAAQTATQGSATTAVRHLAALCAASASFVDGRAAAACSGVVTRCVHRRLSSGV